MYEITINHKDVGQTTYKIFRADEFKGESIHWKEAHTGDYALSDDGYVAKVLKRTEYPNNMGSKSVYLRLPWGYVMWNKKYPTKKFYAEGRTTSHTMTGKPYLEANKRSEKMTNLAMAYAQTMDKELAIDLALKSTTPSERRKWKRTMKSEVFKDMVREELNKLLKNHGMTEDYTLDLLESTIEQAKDKKDITNLMRAVENLQGMHGMKEKHKQKTTTRIEGVVTKRLLDEIREEEQKLIATKTTETNDESHEPPKEKQEEEEVVEKEAE